MNELAIPIGFQEKRTLDDGTQIKSWILTGDDPREAVYGVFNGGGAKGAAFAGAIEIYEQNVKWKEVAGASAGAITSALIAAGYDGASIGAIVNSLDFINLLDVSPLDEVKEAAYPWQFTDNIDFLTGLLKKLDPTLLQPSSGVAIEQQLKAFLEQQRLDNMSFVDWMGSYIGSRVDAYGDIYDHLKSELIENTAWYLTGIVSKVGYKDEADAIFNAINGYFNADGAKRSESLANLLMTVLGANLPPAIQSKMSKDDKPDPDSIIAILLAMYYKGGAFKGQAITDKIEGFLQLAIRPEGQRDPQRPVTFRELPIPLRVMASDISRQQLVSFPDGLSEYGYCADKDGDDNRYLDYSVAEAVRASMSIPMVFQPCYLHDHSAKNSHDPLTTSTLVDGGMLSNFPVGQFGWQKEEANICGFWLGPNPKAMPATSTDRVLSYSAGLLNSMMGAYDKIMMGQFEQEIVLTPIALTIAIDSHEQSNFDSVPAQVEREKALVALNAQLLNHQKMAAQLQQQQNTVNNAEQLENKAAMLAYIAEQLDFADNAINKIHAKIEKIQQPLATTRDCDTLDFALTSEQKEQLIENGRRAANESYQQWKAQK